MNELSDSFESTAAEPFWVTRRGARVALIALHACALAVVMLEFLVPFAADAHAVERIRALDFAASYAIYGFVACVILVLIGLVLRRLVMRAEDFYEPS